MTRRWRLTRRAERSLVEIAGWTLETFGPRQAAAYEEDLIARCDEIAAGTAPSQACAILVGDDESHDLQFTRAGGHFVVFLERPDMVVIVDFLHGRSDLPRRIASLRAMRER